MENLKGRMIFAVIGILFGLVWISPNFVNHEKISWPLKQKLNMGLDIQGGLHIVMGADIPGVVKEGGQRLIVGLKAELAKKNVNVREIVMTEAEHGEFVFNFDNPADKKTITDYLAENYATVLQAMSETEKSLTYRYYESYLLDYKQKIVQQAIETIRNRIDEFGVAEPSISQQGPDRILVQLPGIKDAEQAKQLINTAAKLDFQIVEESPTQGEIQAWIEEVEKAGNYNVTQFKYTDYVARVNKDLAGKIPAGTVVLFEKAENATQLEAGKVPYLLRTDTNLGGDALTDAFVSFDQYGVPEVALRFNAAGASKFKDLTKASVGRRMAVVLDKVVKTAPVIQTEIGTGEARITLGSSRGRDQVLNEAKMISTSLRAGALPVALEQLEERTVGPSLGADSIRQAQRASWAGALLIIIFMIFRYRTMGVISNISLGLNVMFVVALLTSLGATLTLPGIAGIALTVGFAVDANVLINERIREELRKGSSFALAIKEGYSRAMSAILDSNITTAATAVVLLYFGTGPVRGFAVTLLIGIATTLFANVFLTKVFVDLLVHRFGVKKMSV